jgi:MoaA/NifB/PqqE/SkfB family radical SAM enzyme
MPSIPKNKLLYRQFINKKLNKLKSKIFKQHDYKPSFISISVTHSCCLKCKQCDLWKLPMDDALSTQELERMIFELKSWLGSFMLNLSGGEPFMRKDIVELVRYSASLGVPVTITTNGVLLTKKISDELAKIGLANINISLDGFETIHDFTRGKGIFKKVLKNLRYLNNVKRNTNVCIATVVFNKNLEELLSLVEFVKKEKLNGINFQPLINNIGSDYYEGWQKDSILWPKDKEKVIEVFNQLLLMKKRGYPILNSEKQLDLMMQYFINPNRHANYRCLVGKNNFAINEYGKVLICFFMESIGDILKDSPEKIWNSKNANALRKRTEICQRNCDLLNCNFY